MLCQKVSHRFLELCRDDNIWKLECFNTSRAESRRKRQQLDTTDAQLHTLRSAFAGFSGQPSLAPDQGTGELPSSASRQRQRALANWDPSYGDESINFFEEYTHRHAPINIGWLSIPGDSSTEATGIGLLQDGDFGPKHLVGSIDDGSVCVWDGKLIFLLFITLISI